MATVKKQIKNKFYAVTKDVDANDKCPPQAKLIIDTIKAGGGKMSREDLLVALKRPPEQGGLKTNQTAERILGFYKPKLTEMGVLVEQVDITEVDVEVPDKPAKATVAADAPANGTTEAATDAPAVPEAVAPVEHSKHKKGRQETAA